MFMSDWYQSLIKPPFAPPDWIFAPAWSVLYLMIASALVLYILKPAKDKLPGYIYFGVQLLLNLAWVPVFFSGYNPAGAFMIIVLLDIYVFVTLLKFYKISKPAGILLIPYLLWILFATYLNTAFLILN